MSATKLERLTESFGVVPARGTFPVAADTKILKGTLVGLNAQGEAIAADLAAMCEVIVGKAASTVNNLAGSEYGGVAKATEVEVEFGTFEWENSLDADEVTALHVGKLCYAVDNQTVALTDGGGTRRVAGVVVGVYGKQPRVWTGPIVQALCG